MNKPIKKKLPQSSITTQDFALFCASAKSARRLCLHALRTDNVEAMKLLLPYTKPDFFSYEIHYNIRKCGSRNTVILLFQHLNFTASTRIQLIADLYADVNAGTLEFHQVADIIVAVTDTIKMTEPYLTYLRKIEGTEAYSAILQKMDSDLLETYSFYHPSVKIVIDALARHHRRH